MKRNNLIPFLAISAILFIVTLPPTTAISQEDLAALGAGFHEPGDDWWDNEYKYRLRMNFTNTGDRDTNIAASEVDFGDYFTGSDGIIDLASMQLIKVGANQSSQPVSFQVETGAVDIWNPPTMPEVEGALIQAALEENGTFIGTVFNSLQGSGFMNQSFRFEVELDEPSDEVMFQFVYQPEFERNVDDSDYIEIYAGVPSDWGSPVRINRSRLPDEKAWTDYITLPLGSTVDGRIWINMEAPTLFGADNYSYFSIDFVFVDGEGFDGRNVIHFVPELGPATYVSQDVYYPRVQVLETTDPPTCTIYSTEPPESSTDTYFLYFNFMNESNHRIIENDAVPFIGKLTDPQTYITLESDGGLIRVDTDRNYTEGSFGVNMTSSDLSGFFFDSNMTRNDTGFDFIKTFGSQKTTVIHENSTTSVVYTAYKDTDFMHIDVSTNTAITVINNLTDVNTTTPFTHIATNASVFAIDDTAGGTYETDYISFFNNESDQFFMLASNESTSYNLQVDGLGPNATMNFVISGDVTFKAVIVNATESYIENSTAVSEISDLEYDKFMNRLLSPVQIAISNETEVFSPMQLALASSLPAFRIVTVGNKLGFALYGHNLQSMSVNIDNKTSDVAINGTYTVDLTGRNRTLFTRRHNIVVTGRNEFGDNVTISVNVWIADNVLDFAWTFLVYSFTTIGGIVGAILAFILPPLVIHRKKRGSKKEECIGGECNV